MTVAAVDQDARVTGECRRVARHCRDLSRHVMPQSLRRLSLGSGGRRIDDDGSRTC